MLSPPSTRPSDATGRRSSAFVHKDSETTRPPLRRSGGLVFLLGEGAGGAGRAAPSGGGVRKQSGSLGTRPSSPMGHVGNRRSAGESAALANARRWSRTSPECARNDGLIRGRRARLVARAAGC